MHVVSQLTVFFFCFGLIQLTVLLNHQNGENSLLQLLNKPRNVFKWRLNSTDALSGSSRWKKPAQWTALMIPKLNEIVEPSTSRRPLIQNGKTYLEDGGGHHKWLINPLIDHRAPIHLGGHLGLWRILTARNSLITPAKRLRKTQSKIWGTNKEYHLIRKQGGKLKERSEVTKSPIWIIELFAEEKGGSVPSAGLDSFKQKYDVKENPTVNPTKKVQGTYYSRSKQLPERKGFVSTKNQEIRPRQYPNSKYDFRMPLLKSYSGDRVDEDGSLLSTDASKDRPLISNDPANEDSLLLKRNNVNPSSNDNDEGFAAWELGRIINNKRWKDKNTQQPSNKEYSPFQRRYGRS